MPGAKIGDRRPNGAGKSTLIKIMAGIDKDFTGEAWRVRYITCRLSGAGAGARPDQDRAQGKREGRRREIADMLDRFNEIA
jgi:ATPase subunit of ABC transporter with duplicated ATPase domains